MKLLVQFSLQLRTFFMVRAKNLATVEVVGEFAAADRILFF